MSSKQDGTAESASVAGVKVEFLKGGSGPPLLVLHGARGHPGWSSYHGALASHFTVHITSHPGFNGTQRLPWANSITDLAHFYLEFIQDLNLEPVSLLGISMGGWIAAEMAAMCPHALERLVLVGAAGIKPQVGEIAEMFLVPRKTVQALQFYDPKQVADYERLYDRDLTPQEQELDRQNRELAAHLCWKPYMHNPQLPHYLKQVRTPTLVIWGRQDAVVPLNAGELYHQALSNSTLHVIDQCGHSPHIERPQEFLNAVLPFLTGTPARRSPSKARRR